MRKIFILKWLVLSLNCTHLLAQNPPFDPQKQLETARLNLRQEKFARAVTLSQSVLNKKPTVEIEADALTIKGNAHRKLGQLVLAQSALEKALLIRQKHFGNDAIPTANAAQNLAHIFLDSQKPDTAFTLLMQTDRIRTQLLPKFDPQIAKVQVSLGLCFMQKKDWQTAMSHFKRAIETPQYLNPQVLSSLITCCLENADLTQALSFCRKAVNQIEFEQFETTNSEKLAIYNNYALCLRRLGQPEDGIEWLTKALSLAVLPLEKAQIHLNFAIHYTDLDEHKPARFFLQKAKKNADLDLLAIVFFNEGTLYQKEKNWAAAWVCFTNCERSIVEKRIKGQAEAKDSLLVFEAVLARGQCFLKQGKPELAEFALRHALGIWQNAASKNDFLYLKLLVFKAEFKKNTEGVCNNTLFQYVEAIKKLEAILVAATERETIWFWQQQFDYLFDDAIAVALALDQNLMALQFAELAKNVWLRNQFTHRLNRQNVPLSLLEREQDLKKRLSFFEKEVFIAQNNLIPTVKTRRLESLEDSVYRLKRQLSEVTDKIRAFEKSSDDLNNFNDAQSMLSSTQRKLTASEALLYSHVSPTHITLFFIEKNQIIAQTIAKPDDWIEKFKQFYAFLSAPKQSTQQLDSLCQLSYQFYSILIAPFAQKLADKKHLIIVPDGELALLPFEAFQTEKTTSNPWQYPILLRQFDIRYAHSLHFFIHEKRINGLKSPKTVLFTPYFDPKTSDQRPLYFNEKEGAGIAELLSGNLFSKNAATEQAFLAQVNQYDIVHLATHGVANWDNPSASYIAFSDIDDDSENERLYAEEVSSLNLATEMLVLSACQTNIGKILRGEGTLSLARAFSMTGVKSTVTSLWSIDDGTTARLMIGFYTYLKKGMTKSAALRQAKLDFIDKNHAEAHPFFWAAMVETGNDTPIFIPFKWLWWILPPLSILGIFGVIFRFFPAFSTFFKRKKSTAPHKSKP